MKAVLLIGLGRFGQHVARKLNDLGQQVMAVDTDEGRVDAVLPFVTNAQIGDSTNRDFLTALDVPSFDASRGVQEKFLLRSGADEVVYPEKQLAAWTAIRCTSDHILDYIELDEDFSIFELAIPREWAGRTILQLDLRKKYGLNVLGLRTGGTLDMRITPDTTLDEDHSVLILGRPKDVQKCLHL